MSGGMHRALRSVWRVLPESVRTSAVAERLKRAIRGTPEHSGRNLIVPASDGTTAPGAEFQPRVIETIAELDAILLELDAAAEVSDDERRRGFETFRMRAPLDLPPDPDSETYRAKQLELYAWLHGRPYDVANEVSAFDPVATADRPFPFQTASAQTVGSQFIAIGHLIRLLDLPPNSRVLELGAGWGNTSIALARMGHSVTVVDIEENFLALITERSRRKHIDIETVLGDFSIIDGLDRTFDAVLFFESFHHCSSHQSLVASLDRVVVPGGQVMFAGEPIDPDFPQPWGLRLDGQSLWAIRRLGWLELGFREDYFLNLLARHGWTVQKSACSELHGAYTGWGTVYTARRTPG